MGSPRTPPRLIADSEGRPRLKLKRGQGEPSNPRGPSAEYFSATGGRIDSQGRPAEARSAENYRPIRWDLADPPVAAPSGPPDVGLALGLARRSGTFVRLLDQALRAGWVVELAASGFGAGCRKGPHTISLDARSRGAFTGRLVHSIAYANVVADPLPALDPASPAFLHDNAVFLMRRWGHAALEQAIVRDEILFAGGPDIGGPGLRGMQVEAFDIFRRNGEPLPLAIDAIGLSPDGPLARNFRDAEGPLLADNLAKAFVPPQTLVPGTLTPDILDVLERIRGLPVIDVESIGRTFEVELAPRPLVVENPFLSVRAALLDEGPFSWVELREPVLGANHLMPRVILVPRFQLSHYDLSRWYGLGVPHYVDLFDAPLATAVYPFDKRELFVTYAANDTRPLSYFTIHGR